MRIYVGMPGDLLQRCRAARDSGADFPTIYRTVIAGDRLKPGMPTHATDGTRIWLEMSLSSGGRLVYHSRTNDYELA